MSMLVAVKGIRAPRGVNLSAVPLGENKALVRQRRKSAWEASVLVATVVAHVPFQSAYGVDVLLRSVGLYG